MNLIFFIIICLIFASTIANAYISNTVKIELTIGEKTIYINNEPVILDAEPVLRNDRTMVPIRVIAEALGATVTWTSFDTQGAVSIVPKTVLTAMTLQ